MDILSIVKQLNIEVEEAHSRLERLVHVRKLLTDLVQDKMRIPRVAKVPRTAWNKGLKTGIFIPRGPRGPYKKKEKPPDETLLAGDAPSAPTPRPSRRGGAKFITAAGRVSIGARTRKLWAARRKDPRLMREYIDKIQAARGYARGKDGKYHKVR